MPQVTPRTILYTGKGGVGKTSVATATALACARSGMRTIVTSTDPAHSLADSLDVPLGAKPLEVEPNLFAQQVQANEEMERHWSAVQSWLTDLLSDRGLERITAEELTVPPGFDELFALLQIKDHHDSGEYDVIVVDCAPTGETLRLLSFPDVAQWWIEKVFPWERRLISAARPVAKAFLDIPLPDKQVYNEVERLVGSLVAMNDILRDHTNTSLRLVMTPDKMVISEAMRTFTYLNLYGYLTDAVIVNRLFPEETAEGYFASWREAQQENLVSVRDSFSPVPVRTAPYFDEEVIGTAMLTRLGDKLFEDGAEASKVLFDTIIQEIVIEDDNAHLLLSLPFVEKGDIGLNKIGLEVVVRVGDQKRTIMLPNSMTGFKPSGAKVEDGRLRIEFVRAERAAEAIS
ncbi:MAG: ArsA family ATPase [Solirubrobacterales bacterium]|nr:ArsA family ATPase [Solirubrobacterales bacterium]